MSANSEKSIAGAVSPGNPEAGGAGGSGAPLGPLCATGPTPRKTSTEPAPQPAAILPEEGTQPPPTQFETPITRARSNNTGHKSNKTSPGGGRPVREGWTGVGGEPLHPPTTRQGRSPNNGTPLPNTAANLQPPKNPKDHDINLRPNISFNPTRGRPAGDVTSSTTTTQPPEKANKNGKTGKKATIEPEKQKQVGQPFKIPGVTSIPRIRTYSAESSKTEIGGL